MDVKALDKVFGYWFKLFCIQSVVSPDSTNYHFDSHHSRLTSSSTHANLTLFHHSLLVSVPPVPIIAGPSQLCDLPILFTSNLLVFTWTYNLSIWGVIFRP